MDSPPFPGFAAGPRAETIGGVSLALRAAVFPDDIPHLVALERANWPFETINTVPHRRRMLALDPPSTRRFGIIADRADIPTAAPVAYATLLNLYWSFDPQRYGALVVVDPHFHGRGIGRRMAELLLAHLDDPAVDARELRTFSDLNDARSRRFAERHGFTVIEQLRYAELDVQRFDPGAHPDPRAHLAGHGLRIVSWHELVGSPDDEDDPGDEAILMRVHAMESACRDDIPQTDPYASPPFEAWLARRRASPLAARASLFAVGETDDRPAGMTTLFRCDTGYDVLETGITGVRSALRGKGVGSALKVASLTAARSRGAKVVVTENHADNEAILALNERLGFREAYAFDMLARDR
jgi:mycothiol synthase